MEERAADIVQSYGALRSQRSSPFPNLPLTAERRDRRSRPFRKESVMVHAATHGKDVEQCIQNCLDCHRICLECVPHCLQMGGEHAGQAHQVLLQDCAEICQASANFMLRGSQLHARTCGACAEICEACGEQCDRLGRGDEHMTRCAEICRRCAQSCRQMAGRM